MKRTRQRKRRHNAKPHKTRRGGAVLGRGRFGCVVQPVLSCIPAKPGNWVGKIVSYHNRTTPYPNRSMRSEYPIFNNAEFERYQSRFLSEFDKAEEIRARIPHANTMYILPEHECMIHEELEDTDFTSCRGNTNSLPYIQYLMKPAQGDLETLFANTKKTLDPKVLLNALLNIAASILTLHENMIVHCDIKSANILWGISEGFDVRLSDFGIAVFFPLEGFTVRTNTNTSRSSSSDNTGFSMSPRPTSFVKMSGVPPLGIGLGIGKVPVPMPRLDLDAISARSTTPVSGIREFERLHILDWAGMLDVLHEFAKYATIHSNPIFLDIVRDLKDTKGREFVHHMKRVQELIK